MERDAGEPIRADEEMFKLLVHSVRDYAIFVLDPAGNVRSWNAGAERIKGYSAAEVLGKHFSIFYPPEERATCDAALEAAARDGRFEADTWRVRKDGSRFYANVVLTALRDPSGALRGYAKVTRDLTQQRSAEEARVALARLEEEVRARDAFLTVVSHELKTPLHTLSLQVTTALHISKSTAVPDKLRTRMEGAATEIVRLTKLIDRLLSISEIAARVPDLAAEPLDLVSVVKELIAREKDEIDRSGSTVALEGDASVPGSWDRRRLEEVVSNLLWNALKFGERKPVTITVTGEPGRARLVVRDRGVGIAPEHHERIFRRFERAVSHRHYSGFGLGLWMVREIVEAMGGKLSLESAPGQGATFTVELPR